MIVHPEHRKWTKFLWVNSEREAQLIYQFNVLIFGSRSSPFILSQVLETHTSSRAKPICNLASYFYVDNLVKTYEDESELIREKVVIDSVLEEANMPLRGWISISKTFNNTYQVNEPSLQMVLGISWNVISDCITMVVSKKYPIELSSWKATKRNFLSALVAIFDPLGLIAPLVLPGKLLLQQLWLNKVGWDELLSKEHNQIALNFLKDLSQIGIFEFPRKAVTLHSELHIFVDSSSKAFGAVAYSYDRRTNESNLLTSKQRVTPCGKKKLTIPKLELTATLVGARLARHLMTLFDFSSIHLWTDSSVVLSWLNHLDNLKDVYVSNRTVELRYLIDACTIHMHHISTKCNPAHILSRGCTVKQLVNHQLWLHGPVECMHNASTNPSSSPQLSYVHVANVLSEIQSIPPTPPVIDVSRFSTYNKLIAVVSRILALFKSSRSPLEVLVIQEQKLHCPILYQYLDNPNMVVSLEVKKLVSQLNLIKENGILKCKGRINKSDLNAETHTPYYLPKQSMLLRLLLTHIHVMNSHSPVLPTLTLLRQNFWVPRCRPLISLLNRNRVTCRKLRPRAYQVPPPPPLPKERTRYERPFQTIGVDNTGAFTVLMEDGFESQLYITFFVCATTRAVHLEVSPTLTTREILVGIQ